MISLIPNEITIAVILVVVALVVLLISRMGLLPSKSLPYVAGALLAVFGLAFANRLRVKGLRDAADKRRKALEDFANTKAKRDGESADAAARRAAELAAQQDQQDLAAAKSIALINAKTEKDKDAVDNLHGDELHRQLDELAGRLAKEGSGP